MKLELRFTVERRTFTRALVLTASLIEQEAGGELEPEPGPQSTNSCPGAWSKVGASLRGRRRRCRAAGGGGPKGPRPWRWRLLAALLWMIKLAARSTSCGVFELARSVLRYLIQLVAERA